MMRRCRRSQAPYDISVIERPLRLRVERLLVETFRVRSIGEQCTAETPPDLHQRRGRSAGHALERVHQSPCILDPTCTNGAFDHERRRGMGNELVEGRPVRNEHA